MRVPVRLNLLYPPNGIGRQQRLALFFIVALASLQAATALNVSAQTTASSKGLPRFASLKANPVNLRTGPGRQYPKAWVFRLSGLPVEVIQTYGSWRRIRDSEGANGWVSKYLLSNRRTALVLPWEAGKKTGSPPHVNLQLSARTTSKTVARLEAGSLVGVKSCDGEWCYVNINTFNGYILQNQLWGVYPSEKI